MENNCQLRILITATNLKNRHVGPLTTEVILNLQNWFSPIEFKNELQQAFVDIFGAFDESKKFPIFSKEENPDENNPANDKETPKT